MKTRVTITPLTGPLGDAARSALRQNVRHEMARGNVLHVVDLRGVSELDTATLSEVIRVRRWLREVGGALTLVATHPNVLKLLAMCGLDRTIGVHRDEQGAFAALGVPSLAAA